MKRWIVLGVVLIVLGSAFFALNLMGVETPLLEPGLLFLGAIAGGCLAAYVYMGWYGLLIPGCVLASLWLTTTLVELIPTWPGDFDGAIILAGLGVSFFAIYVVDRARTGRRRIWPVWAGVGLVLFSILVALSGFAPESFIGALFVAGPGLVLLAVYLWRRMYGFLIPACYMIALGLVFPAVEEVPAGRPQEEILTLALITGALGLGSLAIYVVHRVYARTSLRWPLIPGFVLLLVSTSLGLAGLGMGLTLEQWQTVGDMVANLWPVGLILLGLWLVLRWARRGTTGVDDSGPREES